MLCELIRVPKYVYQHMNYGPDDEGVELCKTLVLDAVHFSMTRSHVHTLSRYT